MTDITKSFIIQDKRVRGSLGTQGWFTIDSRDSCGDPRFEGGDIWNITLQQNEYFTKIDYIEDLNTGTYNVFFTVPINFPDGVYLVTATIPKLGTTTVQIGSILIAST